MDLTCAVDRRDDVSLVELELRNPTRTARRVRVRNRLEGPVLAPRRHGRTERGWDEDGVTLVVPAGASRGLGYACRAPPVDPPATVTGSEPVDGVPDPERTAADVVAALGDPRPPGDALPGGDPAPDGTGGGEEGATGGVETEAETVADRPSDAVPNPDPESHPDHDTGLDLDRDRDLSRDPDGGRDGSIPPAVGAWLARLERRVETGGTVDAATLEAVATRAAVLAERADGGGR